MRVPQNILKSAVIPVILSEVEGFRNVPLSC